MFYDQDSFPRGIVVSGNAVLNTPAAIFPSTKGAVKIAGVTITIDAAVTGGPLVATLTDAAGTTTYAVVGLNTGAPYCHIPGFEIPAGGLSLTNTFAAPNVRATVRFVREPIGST